MAAARSTRRMEAASKSAVARKRSEPIRSGEAYPVKLFEELTGIGPKGRREAQRNGLNVRGVGKTRHILGEDWLNFLQKRPAEKLPT